MMEAMSYQHEPDVRRCVGLLEAMLEEARAGRLTGLMFAYTTATEVVTGHANLPAATALYVISVMQYRMQREFDEVSRGEKILPVQKLDA